MLSDDEIEKERVMFEDEFCSVSPIAQHMLTRDAYDDYEEVLTQARFNGWLAKAEAQEITLPDFDSYYRIKDYADHIKSSLEAKGFTVVTK